MIAAGRHRPTVAPELARALSRLAARAHHFHRFAHHPLCDAYAPEVLRLSRRTRVCAGCAWTGLGSVLGACLGMARPQGPGALATALGLQALGLGWLLLAARLHARTHKWLLRGGPMVCSAWGLFGVLRHLAARPWQPWVLAAEIALGAAAMAAARVYRRRTPWRAPCATCPQRAETVCAGFRPIVQRERALHRLSGRLLQHSATDAPPSASGHPDTGVDFGASTIP